MLAPGSPVPHGLAFCDADTLLPPSYRDAYGGKVCRDPIPRSARAVVIDDDHLGLALLDERRQRAPQVLETSFAAGAILS
ncbi:MAG TPA: hypothetical protein VG425_09070 [Casimicrobiaceae bacterium]|jgi:hypothetical protein|nr:hypothetical protein [Casimicrobiaceae bacterium]